MKKKFFKIFLLTVILDLCATTTAQAQITIVKNGKAKGRIVRVERNTNNDEAAHLLQRFVERIYGG